MEIKNRLFPYPVLCEDTDDYQAGSFFVAMDVTSQDMNSITLSFGIHLDNIGLKSLISQGRAEFIIHIECPSTAFRTVLRTFSDRETYRISSNRVNGEITFLGMIVAKERIESYRNDTLNSDYSDAELKFPKGAILAYHNMPKLIILKYNEELSQEDSFFSIVSEKRLDQNEQKPVHFELEQDRIKVFVDPEVYSAYILYQNNQAMQPLMLSVLVMPALTFMMEELRKDYTPFMGDRWFIQISKIYKGQGKDFIEDIIESDLSITDIVQELLQLPIGKTLINMPEILGE